MFRSSPCLLATFTACLMTGVAAAQVASFTSSVSSTAATAGPVAYVYVSSQPSLTGNPATGHIYGYAASAGGQLTPISGTPFVSDATWLALNGRWLFGTGFESGLIYSFSIAANGSLKLADSYASSPTQLSPGRLFLDHTGASLYAGTAGGEGELGYEAFQINQKTGKLTLVNGTLETGSSIMTFIGNNQFAYGDGGCFPFSASIYGFARLGGGGLSDLGLDAAFPKPPSGDSFCPLNGVAADPHNVVVVPFAQLSNEYQTRRYVLAVYTADEFGKLSTTSTSANMAAPKVAPQALAMSPKGFYLAAGGSGYYGDNRPGLQLFLMHGSKPPTPLTGVLLPGVAVDQMFWDDEQHLYVISGAAQKLYVFSVATTGSGVRQVAGSPYSIPAPVGLIVLPK